MPRRVVRIKLNRTNPASLLHLLGEIKRQHDTLGVNSPLYPEDMAVVNDILTNIAPKYDEAQMHYADAHALNQQVRAALGIDFGQSASVEHTGLHVITRIRNLLKVIHDDNEKEIGLYGFNVVIGTASVGRKKKTKSNN